MPHETLHNRLGGGTVCLFEDMAAGKVKACWIICTNPVATMPSRSKVIAGLQAAELVIAQDAFLDTETNRYADILLPGALWAEAKGVMVNSERNLTLMQQAVAPPGEVAAAQPEQLLSVPESHAPTAVSKELPLASRLTGNLRLNSAGASKDTRMFALQLGDSELSYEAGDALGVWPRNRPELVQEVLKLSQLNGEQLVSVPQDGNLPMIMIGPGTGVAPFRGFLHERRARGDSGKNWLFFGEQHAASDFYYRDELEAMQRDGLLNQLSLAFSRDQAEKIYVQDRIREQGADLWRWLQDGAYWYICGDASRMAKDVDQALRDVVCLHGGLSAEKAAEHIRQLAEQKRYLRDVY